MTHEGQYDTGIVNRSKSVACIGNLYEKAVTLE